jgi:hypothetical protein
MYGSGSRAMYNSVREIDMTSETTFEKLNSHVQSEHQLLKHVFLPVYSVSG